MTVDGLKLDNVLRLCFLFCLRLLSLAAELEKDGRKRERRSPASRMDVVQKKLEAAAIVKKPGAAKQVRDCSGAGGCTHCCITLSSFRVPRGQGTARRRSRSRSCFEHVSEQSCFACHNIIFCQLVHWHVCVILDFVSLHGNHG